MALSVLITLVVLGLVIGFSLRYRRGSDAKRGPLPKLVQREFELGWTSATVFLFLFIFWWAAASQLSALTPPAKALEIHVVAKQWMWKVEQPSGVREINEIHVPAGTPVLLSMTSQDVIHSLFLPALRLKQDVLPDRIHLSLVHRRQDRHLQPDLRRVLRHQPFAHDRPHYRDAAGGLCAMDRRAAADERASRTRARRCSARSAAPAATAPVSAVHAPDLNGVFGRVGASFRRPHA